MSDSRGGSFSKNPQLEPRTESHQVNRKSYVGASAGSMGSRKKGVMGVVFLMCFSFKLCPLHLLCRFVHFHSF